MIAYAAYSKNEEIRMKSSSGGIFSVIAESFLRNGGLVYGVAMSADCRYAEFVRVADVNDLHQLLGSKYLQAKMGHVFVQVKKDLEQGNLVLFTGTGCQNNGLKSYLGEEYENLFCVDVICHGVPSPLLWRKYLEYVEDKHEIRVSNVNFRCKVKGWTDFGLQVSDHKQKSIYFTKDDNEYMQMFLKDYCLRPSCYQCVAKEHKNTDISLGDFWGIDEVAPRLNDEKGISLVLVRTHKGKAVFEHIMNDLVYKTVTYEEGIKRNSAEYLSSKKPECREEFFSDMKMMSYDSLARKYAPMKKKTLCQKVKRILYKMLARVGILRVRRMLGG